MSEEKEKKDLDRRSFLRGAAAAVGTVAGAGLAMAGLSTDAEALEDNGEGPTPSDPRMRRGDVLYGTPPGDEKSKLDDLKELEPLYQAACEQALASSNKIVEQAVKQGGRGTFRTRSMLRSQGVRLRDSKALKLSRDVRMPPLLARKAEEAKREGWHIHARFWVFTWIHCHVSW